MNNETEKQTAVDSGQNPETSSQNGATTDAPAPTPPAPVKRRQHYYTNLPNIGLEAQPLTAPWQENDGQGEPSADDYDYPDGYKPETSSKAVMAIAITAAAVIVVAVLAFLTYIYFHTDFDFGKQNAPVATADTAPDTTTGEPTTEHDEDTTVVMPDLSGMKEAEAYKALNEANVKYKVVRVNSDDVPFNEIVSQSPPPYEDFPRSQNAIIYLSKGKENEVITSPSRPKTSSTTQPTTTASSKASSAASSGDYILPDSASKELSKSDLAGLDRTKLNLALNEIYARHGRKFSDPDINAYFRSKSWYHPTIAAKDFDMGILNRFETFNVNLITSYQSEMGYR